VNDWEKTPVPEKVNHYLLQTEQSGMRDHVSERHYLYQLKQQLADKDRECGELAAQIIQKNKELSTVIYDHHIFEQNLTATIAVIEAVTKALERKTENRLGLVMFLHKDIETIAEKVNTWRKLQGGGVVGDERNTTR